MNPVPTTATSWTEHYEALRQHVLEGRQRLQAQPLGLALWVAQGMAGWMKQWTQWLSRPSPPRPVPAPVPFRGPWPDQLTCVLAQMTLANLQARKVL